MNEKPMIKGFNDGYLLAKHKPELAKALAIGFTDQSQPYATGFNKGMQEGEKEKQRNKSKAIPKKTMNVDVSRYKRSNRTNDPDKDKDLGNLDRS